MFACCRRKRSSQPFAQPSKRFTAVFGAKLKTNRFIPAVCFAERGKAKNIQAMRGRNSRQNAREDFIKDEIRPIRRGTRPAVCANDAGPSEAAKPH
jgi:hypothetical protein